jgi:4-hydroxy-tetrahydrodipicolinate reductase
MVTKVCVVGATGRFGRSIIAQNRANVEISGAVCSDSSPFVGKRLKELGTQRSDIVIRGASKIEEATSNSDVVLFVSKPEADLVNVPKVVTFGKRVAMGTTGFTSAQVEQLNLHLKKVPSLVAPNFSVGASILLRITKLLSQFNGLYDYSVIEYHHKLKSDAPSGTAKKMLQVLNTNGAFPVTVTDRTVKPKRMPNEVEVLSIRGGGTPGIHQLILSGEHEMIRIEHTCFSRAAAASGALVACEWLGSQEKPGIYTMDDALRLG